MSRKLVFPGAMDKILLVVLLNVLVHSISRVAPIRSCLVRLHAMVSRGVLLGV